MSCLLSLHLRFWPARPFLQMPLLITIIVIITIIEGRPGYGREKDPAACRVLLRARSVEKLGWRVGRVVQMLIESIESTPFGILQE